MRSIKLFNSVREAKERMQNRKPVLISIGDKKLCGIRIDEKINVVDNTCPHSGEMLHKGSVNHLNEIVCPLHNYRYNLLDGRECNERTVDLEIYPINVSDEGVFINI